MRGCERLRKTALITGADHPTGLGTARALRNTGALIIGFCKNPNSPCCVSKIWKRLVKIGYQDEELLKSLFQEGQRLSTKGVLFPSDDRAVKVISENRDFLKKYWDFVFPDRAMTNMLLDKVIFQRWAEKNGFSIPTSHCVYTQEELEDTLAIMKMPVIIKPFVRTASWDSLSPMRKVIKLKKKQDIQLIGFDLFAGAKSFVIQEWIEGSDENIFFCLSYFNRDGKELAYYTGKKLIQWPVGEGSTSVAIGVNNEDVHRLTKDFFEKAGYRGIGSLELKWSKIDGKYYIIEPTVGRNDLQSNVAVAGGVNIGEVAYKDAIGSKLNNCCIGKKGVWIEEDSFLDAIRCSLAEKQFKARMLLKLLTIRMSFSYFCLRDPAPSIMLWRKKLSAKISYLADCIANLFGCGNR